MDINRTWLESLLIEKTQEDCVAEVLTVESKPATAKGDNYSGEMQRIVMDVVLRSGRRKKKSLIVKEMPSSEYRREIAEKVGIFKKEVLMYRDILPAMECVMREFGDLTEFMWGKCLYHTEFDKIIMNDLTEEGYGMKNRKIGLDLEHCLLVVRSLAKFHAASVIIKKLDLIPIGLFREHVFVDSFCLELNTNFQTDIFKRFADLVDCWEPEWKPVADKIRSIITPNLNQLMKDTMKLDENRFNVLCHGDCWVNNIMFKHGLDGVTPISAKFVDFQLSCYNSPALDLTYFLALSINKDVRKNSIPHILEVYHESLCKELQMYSYKGNIISFNDLLKEMDRLTWFGITVAVRILPLMLMENTQEIPDMEKLTKELVENKNINTETWAEYFKPPPTYIEIIKDILTDAVKKNTL